MLLQIDGERVVVPAMCVGAAARGVDDQRLGAVGDGDGAEALQPRRGAALQAE
jgi:hypothetical protein